MGIRVLLFTIKGMEVKASKFWLKELYKGEMVYMR